MPEAPAKRPDDPIEARFRGAEPAIAPARAAAPGSAYRDVVVIGASAGGVEALTRLMAALPAELPASLFVVLHLSPTSISVLPAILARAGSLPASVPSDGERVERGHVYVAPPDRHLLLAAHGVRVSAGPRENGHRPAIDPLFRSAARTYGPRVVSVILSGTLDDGAAGARVVKERGGAVLVQADALHPDMPDHAAAATDIDAMLPVEELAGRICRLVEETVDPDGEESVSEREAREAEALASDETAPGADPAELACPECGGPLWEREEGRLVRFACRVGHVYSPESLVSEQGKELERALWTALRGLEERTDLYRRMASRASGRQGISERFEGRARAAEANAGAIRDAIARLAGGSELEQVS